MEQPASASSQRYAPPTAEVADVSGDDLPLAGRGIRLGAAILDTFVLGAVLWLVGKVTPWNAFDFANAARGTGAMLPMMIVSAVAFMLVNGFLLITRGQTVAKLLLGLRIVRTDGSQASPGRIIGLRYMIGYLLGVFPMATMAYGLVDALLIFRSSRKCLHDTIADTIVVKV